MNSTHIRFENTQQQTARRLLRFGWLPVVLALAAAGCNQKPPVAAAADPTGTYTLVSVDGKNVPCTVQHEGHTLEVKSGAIILNADGSCSSKTVFVPPSGNDVSNEVAATYTRQGSNFTMQWKGAGTTTATVQGDTFSMNNEGMILSYRK